MSRRVDTEADLGDVRHDIDVKKLEKYLCRSLPQKFIGPITLKQFGYGQSNPSYQITEARGRKYVLRKQPPGSLLSKTAHRVDREFYMQQALKKHTQVPVAEVLILCEDKNIIGTMFYVMEFLQGRIFHEPRIEGVEAKDRTELWDAAIKAIAQLHAVDPSKIGLPPNMTRNMSSHYPRQVKSMAQVVASQAEAKDPNTGEKLGPIEGIDEILGWMKHKLPSERVSIVHGDYKIDNIVFHPTENRVIGILDWELCTIGHPLADLGNLLQPYSFPQLPNMPPAFRLDKYPGLPSFEEQLLTYKKYSGYDPRPDFKFAVVYAHMRLAMITHGISARVLQGQASSANAKKVGQLYGLLANLAMEEINKDKESQSKL